MLSCCLFDVRFFSGLVGPVLCLVVAGLRTALLLLLVVNLAVKLQVMVVARHFAAFLLLLAGRGEAPGGDSVQLPSCFPHTFLLLFVPPAAYWVPQSFWWQRDIVSLSILLLAVKSLAVVVVVAKRFAAFLLLLAGRAEALLVATVSSFPHTFLSLSVSPATNWVSYSFWWQRCASSHFPHMSPDFRIPSRLLGTVQFLVAGGHCTAFLLLLAGGKEAADGNCGWLLSSTLSFRF